jgi:endonuclease YncB( thermonuclease family)
MLSRSKYILLVILVFCACTTNDKLEIPNEFTSKVIAVKDGDTIEVLFDGKPIRIRFANIDCPEIRNSQPFGKAAKQFTSRMCFGETVTVLDEGKFDRYHRLIAVIVNAKGENINKALVKAGLAWHYKKYSTDAEYAALENVARQNKVGLWADNDPIAPWDWRNNKRIQKTNSNKN